ncbi:uS9 family ribosomal protein [Candidatus Carsonella ruddii]|uniref:Small ribosomal subunit protein uS9 n=1 Tax=Candidatus Carsonella ruddii PC isolate NHV TaxID=1202540 RepID=J3YQN0_CARRU|nr:uS9 family ribosomal protein [Candidatus Carsonella ruddii]AFP84273.1 ribosomal protein S9 [Candidatus Carsonella ruddii PC isolate NHV]
MNYISFSKKKKTITRVKITIGTGIITINKLSIKNYFGNIYNKNYMLIPLILINLKNKNILINTKGGGKSSQIYTIKIAICKCILLFNFNYYKLFRKLNLTTIDDRKNERKKYGYKKSRKKEQYSKR